MATACVGGVEGRRRCRATGCLSIIWTVGGRLEADCRVGVRLSRLEVAFLLQIDGVFQSV